MPAMQGARVVLMETRADVKASAEDFIASVDAPLNPYQPNQRIRVPRTTRGMLWGSKLSLSCPQPSLGLTIAAPTIPATPPVMCTMPLPAKSRYAVSLTNDPSSLFRKPTLVHVQCTTHG